MQGTIRKLKWPEYNMKFEEWGKALKTGTSSFIEILSLDIREFPGILCLVTWKLLCRKCVYIFPAFHHQFHLSKENKHHRLFFSILSKRANVAMGTLRSGTVMHTCNPQPSWGWGWGLRVHAIQCYTSKTRPAMDILSYKTNTWESTLNIFMKTYSENN